MPVATIRNPTDRAREWTVALGVLTSAGTLTADDAKMKLAAYVPLLTDQFPTHAFCQASLQHVAAQCKFFPSYAEVAAHLRTWWRDNRPIHNALPPPLRRNQPEQERPEPTDEERAYVHHRVAEITATLSAAAAAKDEPHRSPPGPRHLSPQQLDIVNPLPNGIKRAAPQ